MPKQSNANIFLILLGAALVAGYILLRPYLASVLVGGVLAAVAYPAYELILRLVRFRTLAGIATVLLVVCIIFIPLYFVAKTIAGEAANVYSAVTANGGTAQVLEKALERVPEFVPKIKSEDIGALKKNTYLKDALLKVVEHTGSISSKTAEIALHIVISLFTLYYLLKDGKKFRERLMELSPLKKSEDEKVLEKIKVAVTSIIRGSIVVGVVQGVLTGVGFELFGIPNAVL